MHALPKRVDHLWESTMYPSFEKTKIGLAKKN
jgi:hypothetical protein